MKENERRDAKRHKCRNVADLICEHEACGHEEYQSIHVVDQSESGMQIESEHPIDTSAFLTVSMNLRYTEKKFPAEFVWMHREKSKYMAGLKKI